MEGGGGFSPYQLYLKVGKREKEKIHRRVYRTWIDSSTNGRISLSSQGSTNNHSFGDEVRIVCRGIYFVLITEIPKNVSPPMREQWLKLTVALN
jgi:hypothetical protein